MNNSRGFTLIEIMAAMVIFSLVFMPLTAILVAESKLSNKSERKRVAMLVARNELEKIKRHWEEPKDEEYDVPMAGKQWRVKRVIDTEEKVKAKETATVQLCGITISVSAEKDTTTLAEFKVLRETYR